MSSNVVSINRRDDQTSFGEALFSPHQREVAHERALVVAQVIESLPPAKAGDLTLKQLYSELDEDSRIIKALDTLERAKGALLKALQIDPETEFAAFDLELMAARSFLLNAFRYRDIGQGYAAVVNAALWALSNRGSKILSRRQINVIIGSLGRISEGPYLHFDTSMQVLDDLEDADLNIEPPSLDILTADLDD